MLVDMPATDTRTGYHHGSLYEELISTCMALIESEGIGAVSLRRIAREAGVSPGAPYHHFADRAELLNIIAARGYEELTREMSAARESAASPVEALGAMFESYVRFAGRHTAYHRLMFRPELSRPEKHPTTVAAGDAALRLVTEAVEDCQRVGAVPPGDPMPLMTMAWSLGTGLATLWLDGPLEHLCRDRDTTVEDLTGQVARLLESMLR
jgi:AcrR family transcriptional regulator